jgi:hypothetical protein
MSVRVLYSATLVDECRRQGAMIDIECELEVIIDLDASGSPVMTIEGVWLPAFPLPGCRLAPDVACEMNILGHPLPVFAELGRMVAAQARNDRTVLADAVELSATDLVYVGMGGNDPEGCWKRMS